jgi:hypothetical protein
MKRKQNLNHDSWKVSMSDMSGLKFAYEEGSE